MVKLHRCAVSMWMLSYALISGFSEDLPSDLEIVMNYAGGYSPLKQAQVLISKKANGISYSIRREYYEEENQPPEEREGSLSEEKFKSLLEKLQKNNVWDLGDLKEYVATDGFTYTITIREGQKSHTFKVYFPELQQDSRYKAIVRAVNEAVGE